MINGNVKFMTKQIVLAASIRAAGKAKQDRKAGFIPATLYGPGFKSVNLNVIKLPFEKVLAEAGESHLIDLAIGKDVPVKMLIKDIQRHPVKGNVIHADFFKVDMTKKITAEIPFRFIGESRAVKELGGVLVKSINSVEVKCLADNLVDSIEVDLGVLANLHDSIKLHGLKLPAGIELVSHTDEVIVNVVEQQVEKEIPKAAVEAAPVAGATPAAGSAPVAGSAPAKGAAQAQGKK